MLKKFDIEIKEELARVVTVEAETLGEAIDQVMDMYDKGEIVLDADDFVGKEVHSMEIRKGKGGKGLCLKRISPTSS